MIIMVIFTSHRIHYLCPYLSILAFYIYVSAIFWKTKTKTPPPPKKNSPYLFRITALIMSTFSTSDMPPDDPSHYLLPTDIPFPCHSVGQICSHWYDSISVYWGILGNEWPSACNFTTLCTEKERFVNSKAWNRCAKKSLSPPFGVKRRCQPYPTDFLSQTKTQFLWEEKKMGGGGSGKELVFK